MAIRVEHELHRQRRGRNIGLGLVLAGLIAVVFGLTVVKILQLGNLEAFERFDRVVRPQIIPDHNLEAPPAAPAGTLPETTSQ